MPHADVGGQEGVRGSSRVIVKGVVFCLLLALLL
jgi:hypothetical protein